MSLLDQLHALEQQIQRRLRELGPLVAEYRDLEKVAQRLGLKRDDDATDAAAAEAAEPAPARKPAAQPRAKRAARTRSSKRAPVRKPKAKATAEPAAAATEPPTSTAASTPEPAPASKAKPAAASTPKRTSARRASRKPRARKRPAAAPGQRQQDVLRLVRERPGITVAELATELGVDATGLYGVVRRLQSNGQISKDGPQLRAADAATTTTDASPTSQAPSAGRARTPPAELNQQTTEPPASES
jgi:hypothetical protein